MASKKIITVFGATGKQGGSIVRTFLNDAKLKDTWAIRGVSRSVESEGAKKLSAQGVEVVAVSPRYFTSASCRPTLQTNMCTGQSQ